MRQGDLLGAAEAIPGFAYRPDFLSPEEEDGLLDILGSLPFEAARYREWHARRRIVSYGGRYDFTHRALGAAPPIPGFLWPLRERLAAWAGLSSSAIHHATVVEYRPGAQLGWHRDVPDFEEIVGVSLRGPARMRLRPYPPGPGARAVHVIELQPRSAYQFRGPARWGWQHAISPVKSLRYSITFRTLRSAASS